MQAPVTVITLSTTPPTDDDQEDEAAAIDRAHERFLEARDDPDSLLDADDARKRVRELQDAG